MYLPNYLSMHRPFDVCMHLSIYRLYLDRIYLFMYLPIYLSMHRDPIDVCVRVSHTCACTRVSCRPSFAFEIHYSALAHFLCHPSPSLWTCPLCIMPNGHHGSVWAQCWHCRQWTNCHLRPEEEYYFWVGYYCDTCCDWINEDDHAWLAFHSLVRTRHQISGRVSCTAHDNPLVALVALYDVLESLVQFIHDPH